MNRKQKNGLLVLNATLLAALALVTFAPIADAQRNRSVNRARGEYTMVAGQVQGLAEAAIYIIDSNNEELVAVRWDQSRQDLAPIGYRNLALDARGTRGGGR